MKLFGKLSVTPRSRSEAVFHGVLQRESFAEPGFHGIQKLNGAIRPIEVNYTVDFDNTVQYANWHWGRPESVGLELIRKFRRDRYRKRTTCAASRRSQDSAHARQREAHPHQRRLSLGAEGNSRNPAGSGSRRRYDLHEPRGTTAFRINTGRAFPSCQAERRKGAANRPRAATS